MDKTLDFHLPRLNHVPFDNQVLALLYGRVETYGWQMENFLHMYINKVDFRDYFFPRYLWKMCPFISVYSIPYILIKNSFCYFTDFIRQCIKINGYVYCWIDMKDIPEYNCNIDTDHNPLIIGINDTLKTVQIADFFDGKYKIVNSSFESINKAFYHFPSCDAFGIENYCNYMSYYYILFYKKEKYEFDINKLKLNLKKYLNGNNLFYEDGTYIHHNLNQNQLGSLVFGIEVYNFIKLGNLSRRILCMLRLHSEFWIERLLFLRKEGYINVDEDIIKKAQYIRKTLDNSLLIYLRNRINGKAKDATEMINNNIEICKNLEVEIINYVLNNIN